MAVLFYVSYANALCFCFLISMLGCLVRQESKYLNLGVKCLQKQIYLQVAIQIIGLIALQSMKPTYSDQLKQQLARQLDSLDSKIACTNGNVITHICINPQCDKNSFHCQNESCETCSCHNLNGCSLISFNFLIQSLKKRKSSGESLLASIRELQEKMIQAVWESINKIEKEIKFGYLEKKYSQIIDSIFSKDLIKIKGAESAELVDYLRKDKAVFQKNQQKVADQCKKTLDQIAETLILMHRDSIQKLFMRGASLKSRIITPSKLQSFQFIQKQLNFPKKFELLFRASQNRFLASQFHKKCDNIENTLTLVQTQFGKVLAAFAHPKFQSLSSIKCANYSPDPTGQSFLLAVDSKLKIPLVESKYAVYCYKEFGPAFGRGFDLKIGDRCNETDSSLISLQHSYSFDKGLKLLSKQIAQICGSPQGMFRVWEYQVFKVIK